MFSMCPEGLFRLQYITVHLYTVMSRGNALGKYTFIEHNKSVIFKTIIDNNFTKNILTTNHIQ